jgi:hypothetical protein
MASKDDTDAEKPQGYSSAVQTIDPKDSDSGKKGAELVESEIPPFYDGEQQGSSTLHLETAEDLVTTIIHLDDDPTLNPWTFRMFFIGEHHFQDLTALKSV